MKPLALLGLLFALFTMSSTAQAEGGTCPNGYYPINSPGVLGCAPIPGYNQYQQAAPQPPLPRWEDRWGAIATDAPHGVLASVTGMLSKSLADQAAMADCKDKGGTSCKLKVAYANGCAALVIGSKIFNVTADDTVNTAAQMGVAACSAEDTNCHLYHSACSPPVRVQ